MFQIYRLSDGIITHQGNLQEIKAEDPVMFAEWQKAVKRARYGDEYFFMFNGSKGNYKCM